MVSMLAHVPCDDREVLFGQIREALMEMLRNTVRYYDLEDIVHDCIVEILRILNIKPLSEVIPLLPIIAKCMRFLFYRKQTCRKKLGVSQDDLSFTPDPQEMRQADARFDLRAAFEKLPPELQEKVSPVWFQGRSQHCVAKELGISQTRMSHLVRKAAASMRQLLSEDYKPDKRRITDKAARNVSGVKPADEMKVAKGAEMLPPSESAIDDAHDQMTDDGCPNPPASEATDSEHPTEDVEYGDPGESSSPVTPDGEG